LHFTALIFQPGVFTASSGHHIFTQLSLYYAELVFIQVMAVPVFVPVEVDNVIPVILFNSDAVDEFSSNRVVAIERLPLVVCFIIKTNIPATAAIIGTIAANTGEVIQSV
jgi:hypothetical protein